MDRRGLGVALIGWLAACATGFDIGDRERVLGMRTDAESDGTEPEPRRRAPALIHGPADPQVAVPSGKFMMGCVAGDEDCEDDERPAHAVKLHEFRIDKFEVTWARYAECVEAGACSKVYPARCYVWNAETRRFVVGAGLDDALIGPDQPVVCATWKQAREYCRYRGGTLPTEAQWERAARADRRTRYPWGDEVPSCRHAHWSECVDATQPVGTADKGASYYGAHDMAGNAWEWVGDWYAKKSYTRFDRGRSPRGPWEGDVRVVRGGSFYDDVIDLRTSYRYGLSPQYGYSTVGFRCAARTPRAG
ncbi:MAG TPA: SUMF1/EgtB/PvdO family nonheme iron enzyme [Nannocystaceae bacterium]|nr:SUMF1/EgtB/PvdO family nonheme iron enzyme [Nannocystaceae bacterium]